MWFLYLDESGDLGFDFVSKKPSKFFTISILAVQGKDENRHLINAVRAALNRKLNPRHKRKRIVQELKGTDTTLAVKQFFMEKLRLAKVPFALFSLSLNKRRVYEQLTREKERVYNYLAKQILDHIRFENAKTRVYLYVDKSKSKTEITDFNRYIERAVKARLHPLIPLQILHVNSVENRGLQAVDLFCWGIFQKHERGRTEWYDQFKQFVKLDEQYL